MEPRSSSGWKRLGQILGMGAAYFAAGKLALMLAIPPGYATAVWPSAGLALAGVLLLGYEVWPGILLGSFATNLLTGLDASNSATVLRSLPAPTLIAVGATLQALAGAFLTRRLTGDRQILDQDEDLFKLLAAGGPVSCLLNATFSTAALLALGSIQWNNVPFSWFTWWVGDTIGVLVFTPLVLVFAAKPRRIWMRRQAFVILPLCFTFLCIVVLFVFARGWEQERIRLEFDRRAENLSQTLLQSLERYIDVLHSVEGLYASSPQIDRREFHDFVDTMFASHPGIQALVWAPRARLAQRAALEDAARRTGYPNFQFTERDAGNHLVRAVDRAEYVPVYYLEPFAGNEPAMGFDLASEPVRRQAAEQARDTGKPAATARIKLVQERKSQFGIVIFQPVYRRGAPHVTVADRRQNLESYTTAVFRIDDLMEATFTNVDLQDIHIQLYDRIAPGRAQILYSNPTKPDLASEGIVAEEEDGKAGDFTKVTRLNMLGRPWEARFSQDGGYLAAHRSWQAWTFLAAGLLFTALLEVLLLVVTGRTAKIEALVAQRTAELQSSNQDLRESEEKFRALAETASGAIVSTDSAGRIIYFNRGAERAFGYTPAESMGQPITVLMPPELREEHLKGLERYLATGDARVIGRTVEMTGRRKDGTEFPLDLSLSSWRTHAGVFFTGILNDISERKAAEAALKDSEARLKLALDSAEMGVWDLDVVHDKTVRSLRHDLIFGYSSLQAKWSAALFLNHVFPEDRDMARASFEEAFRTGDFNLECRIVWPDQSIRWISALGRLYRNAHGHPIRMMGVMADITSRKRNEEALERQRSELARANAELEAANKELEAFSYSVSHDLRAPLRAIDGFSTILLQDYPDKLDREGKDLLQSVRAAAGRMGNLIDDLLKLARTSRCKMDRKTVDMTGLAQEIVGGLRSAGPERQVVFDVAPGLVAEGDQGLLRVALENLLGNAWKFTSKQPAARIEFGAEFRNRRKIHFVRDNGAGFDMKYADKLFGVFQRLHDPNEFPGTGIGLATVQRIIHRHGGQVWAEATPGGGATFYFALEPVLGEYAASSVTSKA